MASFVGDLWQSVFTPGTSPALIKATHASFFLLVVSLTSLIFIHGSIHFYNLLAIALALWGAVIWFISELAKEKKKLAESGDAKKEQ